jgi:hypothetical protein
MKHLTDVATRDGFIDSKVFRFVIGATIRAEQDVHKGRDVRVVSRIAATIVVPMMQLRRSNQHAYGPIGRHTLE